nr:MAG TPA: hypothetical protein [Caudoviricetes sp.]
MGDTLLNNTPFSLRVSTGSFHTLSLPASLAEATTHP